MLEGLPVFPLLEELGIGVPPRLVVGEPEGVGPGVIVGVPLCVPGGTTGPSATLVGVAPRTGTGVFIDGTGVAVGTGGFVGIGTGVGFGGG